MTKGWRNESRRHSLARRGVKTAVTKACAVNKVPPKIFPDVKLKKCSICGSVQEHSKGYGCLRCREKYRKALSDYGSSLTDLQKDRFYELGFKSSIVNDGDDKIVYLQRIKSPYDIQGIRFRSPFIKSKINTFLDKESQR